MIRKIVKKNIFSLLRCCGYPRYLAHKNLNEQTCVVLNFHKVSPQHHPFYPSIHPKNFHEALLWLKKHCSIEGLRSTKKGNLLKVVLSFDDGYYDFIEYVVPILERYNLTANQNIIVKSAETGLPPWNICLYDWFLSEGDKLINELHVPGIELTKADKCSPERLAIKVGRHLKFRPREERNKIIKDITPQFSPKDVKGLTRMLSVEEVKSLASTFEIGCHSYEHESMEHQNIQYFKEDFLKCQSFFKQHNLPLEIYAFPNGSYNEQQCDYLLSTGVNHVLLVEEKRATLKTNLVPRLTLYGESPNEIIVRAMGFASKGQL